MYRGASLIRLKLETHKGIRSSGVGIGGWGLRFGGKGLGVRSQGFMVRGLGLGFGVWGSGVKVENLGLRV